MLQYGYEMNLQQGGRIYWVQCVYVIPDARRIGVFNALFARAKQDAEADPLAKSMRLYVGVQNQIAQQVYGRKGFERTDEFNYVDY